MPGRKLDGLGRTARSHDKNRTRGAPPRLLHMTFLTVYSARFNPSEAPKKIKLFMLLEALCGAPLKKGAYYFLGKPTAMGPPGSGPNWETDKAVR